jgi:hypothetical protein
MYLFMGYRNTLSPCHTGTELHKTQLFIIFLSWSHFNHEICFSTRDVSHGTSDAVVFPNIIHNIIYQSCATFVNSDT